jgi:hypothetical protein
MKTYIVLLAFTILVTGTTAGFRLKRVLPTESQVSIVEAVPA